MKGRQLPKSQQIYRRHLQHKWYATFNNLYSSNINSNCQVRKDERGMEYSKLGRGQKSIQNFSRKT